jgi:aspartate aminotransferase
MTTISVPAAGRGPANAPGKARLRQSIVEMPPQLIGEVSRLGMGQDDIIPLWYGESDVPTPAFIYEAAHRAMLAGETFYTHKLGLPVLRQALAVYLSGLYAKPVAAERVSVTASGMNAIMLALMAILDGGDDMVLIDPVWPNCEQSALAMGASVTRVSLAMQNGAWRLDPDALFAACKSNTRAIFVNSPGNPTGWMIERDQQQAILEFARERGIWILADEVYARLVYDRPVAPSFLDIAEPDDPVIVINSFSKSWAMTGWRIGWTVTPEWVTDALFSMIEYHTSCVPPFLQMGALAAVEQGEPFVAEMVARCRAGREAILPVLQAMPGVHIDPPRAAFYAFFRVDGIVDSLKFAQDLFRTTKVGVAPGRAFGEGGEGWLRLCFAQKTETLSVAAERLAQFIASRQR